MANNFHDLPLREAQRSRGDAVMGGELMDTRFTFDTRAGELEDTLWDEEIELDDELAWALTETVSQLEEASYEEEWIRGGITWSPIDVHRLRARSGLAIEAFRASF